MRSLHPDNGGDDSDLGRAAISEVVAAWRVLSGQVAASGAGPPTWIPTQDPNAADEGDTDEDEGWPTDWVEVDPEDRMSPRLLRVFFVASTVLVIGWLLIFFVIAWSQSG